MKYALLSWEDVYRLSRKLAEKVVADYKPTTIVALARGGWFPARVLCDYLGITELLSVKVEHWVGTAEKTLEDAVIKVPIGVSLEGKRVLVVDDIVDTGRSMKKVVEHVKTLGAEEVRTAAMQYIVSSEFEPDYYAEKVIDWTWFIYPWNLVEDTMNIARKNGWPADREVLKKLFREELSLEIPDYVLMFTERRLAEQDEKKI